MTYRLPVTVTAADPGADPEALHALQDLTARLVRAVGSVVEGKDAAVTAAVTVLLAGGHLLVEDVPGVGKTMLAKALAAASGCTVSRIQFTPDLFPSDVTGGSVYDAQRHDFTFTPGPVFANVVIADEINRASPKTQSALLECMAEGQVTADGRTYGLAEPFMVVATQNPLEMEGTYPLPEAQRDRFMARISMGYPSARAELAMLEHHGSHDPLAELTAVADAAQLARAVAAIRSVPASEAVRRYVVDLLVATRAHPRVALGASPRAGLHLLRAARAHAAVHGDDVVLPDHVQALAATVLGHRLVLTPAARAAGERAEHVLAALVADTPVHAGP